MAVLLAGLIFFLTMLADPSGKKAGGTGMTPLTPQVGSGQLAEGDTPNVGKYFIEFPGRSGVIYQLFGDALNPLPQGVMKVEGPMARIHLKRNQRVIQVKAERGTFVAPDNRPRSGQFEGDVLLTLFESPEGERISFLPDSPHAQMRLLLRDTSFNLDLGEIRSAGRVHAISREFEFEGEELDLIYNELQQRIDRLEIARGKQLRIRRDIQRASDEDVDESVGGTAGPDDKADDDRPDQYYSVDFKKQVVVLNDGNRINGETLNVLFGVKLSASDQSDDTSSVDSSASTADAESVTDTGLAGPLPQSLVASDTDIIVNWRGAMLLEPLDQKPAELADVSDIKLSVTGQPLRVLPGGGQTITGTTLSYLESQELVKVIGTDAHPMVLDSPELGVLRAMGLNLYLNRGSGQLIGDGVLRTHGETMLVSGDPDDGRVDRLPPGTSVRWSDRVDLTFYDRSVTKGEPDTASSRTGLAALKNIVFRGEVLVEHVQFDLGSNVLAIGLQPPKEGKQELQSVVASGAVKFKSHSSKLEDRIAVDSDQMNVVLQKTDSGKTRPSSIVAIGSVHAHRENEDLYARKLTVNLLDPDAPVVKAAPDPSLPTTTKALDAILKETPAATDKQLVFDEKDTGTTPTEQKTESGSQSLSDGGGLLAVQNIIAEDNVRVELRQQKLTVYAGKLVAQKNQIELFAAQGQRARIERADGTLYGNHIVMVPDNESLFVVGPGELASKPEPGVEQAPMKVVWQDNMRFYNTSGQARFYGGVVASTYKPREVTSLKAKVITIAFHTFEALREDLRRTGELSRNEDASAAADEDENALRRGLQEIKTITADGEVVFEASTWADYINGKLLTRMHLTGPTMVFDNLVTEQFSVKGAGTLLIEDHREDKPGTRSASRDEVQITGKGATLFTWKKQFLVNLIHNDMKIEEQVQVLHVPEGTNDTFQLDCRRLLADLASSGGLGVMMNTDAPRPELKAIYADNDVRVISRGRQMYTDHLEYTHFDNTIVLRADENKQTRVYQANGQSGSARLFRWNLETDRMEIIDPGRTVAPASSLTGSRR